jgi:hypothetical protein
MSAERKCGRLLSGWRAAAMSDAEYIAELTRLGKELDATDSKAREVRAAIERLEGSGDE